jgi:methyltransferase-like protein 6
MMSSGTISIYGQPSDRVPPLLRKKYEKETGKHWNTFYKNHSVNFFKDRHYLQTEFEVLNPSTERRTLLELGCGVGNTVFPLIAQDPLLKVHCCDFSKEAVRLVKENKQYSEERVNAFVCDITKDALVDNVPESSVDIVTLIFVISAIPPEKLEQSIANIARVLRPGALVLVRDYSVGDLAQERLNELNDKKVQRKLDENYYVRGDGTFVHYFTQESLRGAFEAAGRFKLHEMKVCEREIENRKKQMTMHRKWIQAVFEYTGTTSSSSSSSSSDKKYEWQTDPTDNLQVLFGETNKKQEELVDVAEGLRVKVNSVHRENIHSEPSTGLMLWDGSKALAKIIATCPARERFKGKTVIELGCGCSPLCAIALCSTAEVKQAAITDGNSMALDMLKENLALNSENFDLSAVHVRTLAWDNEEDIEAARSISGLESSAYDIVIASDVLYIEQAIPPLFMAAGKLLSRNPSSFFLICYTPRRAIEDRALLAAKKANLKLVDMDIDFQQALGGEYSTNTMRLMMFSHSPE